MNINLKSAARLQNKDKVVQFPKTPWFEIKNQTKDSVDVYIYDEISPYLPGCNATDVVIQLRNLTEVNQLNVHINSPGGSVFEGIAIYNVLKAHPGNVTVYVDGIAASIASIIMLAGDKIVMSKYGMVMIHDPSSVAWGTAEELRKTADVLDQIKTVLVTAYMDKTGKKKETVINWMTNETWFTADEALAAKLADEQMEPVKAAAKFDLTAFGYARAPMTDKSPEPPPSVVADKLTPPVVDKTTSLSAEVPDQSKVEPRVLRSFERKQALLEKSV